MKNLRVSQGCMLEWFEIMYLLQFIHFTKLAIRYYRQAIQLLPDIESRISDFNETELPLKQGKVYVI